MQERRLEAGITILTIYYVRSTCGRPSLAVLPGGKCGLKEVLRLAETTNCPLSIPIAKKLTKLRKEKVLASVEK
jgi:hypothetical protein